MRLSDYPAWSAKVPQEVMLASKKAADLIARLMPAPTTYGSKFFNYDAAIDHARAMGARYYRIGYAHFQGVLHPYGDPGVRILCLCVGDVLHLLSTPPAGANANGGKFKVTMNGSEIDLYDPDRDNLKTFAKDIKTGLEAKLAEFLDIKEMQEKNAHEEAEARSPLGRRGQAQG